MVRISHYRNGEKKSIRNMNFDEKSTFRVLQTERAKLGQVAKRSICQCFSCGKADRDMTYNKSYDSWYCTECYNSHRLYAKNLFQTIGKTKPQGHEEEVIHDLYESFLYYEESHEIELGLVREGILIYLLRFHFPSSNSPYASLSEFRDVLSRSQKAIAHVLNSLEHVGLIELSHTEDRDARLTNLGLEEANNALSKAKRIMGFGHAFPESIEEFHLLLDIRSDEIEYENPRLIERIINELKLENTPPERIRQKVEELKLNLNS